MRKVRKSLQAIVITGLVGMILPRFVEITGVSLIDKFLVKGLLGIAFLISTIIVGWLFSAHILKNKVTGGKTRIGIYFVLIMIMFGATTAILSFIKTVGIIVLSIFACITLVLLITFIIKLLISRTSWRNTMTRPMTITEKIFAAHANLESVKAGDLITAKVDITLANDITGPVAIKEFKKIGVEKVFDKQRVVFVPDHFVPNKDIKSAQQAKMVREFSKEQNLKNYFEVGRMGIEHALLPEKGIVTAGDLIIGADSHTCTYGALGAFSTGVGSTDLACAMASGETWFKVPSTIKVEFNGKLNKWVSAKDLILHLIGDIGVDGALYKTLEIGGSAIKDMDMDGRLTICNMAIEAGAI